MRALLVIGFLLFLSFGQMTQAQNLQTVNLKIIGKAKQVLLSTKTETALPQNVGQISVDVFKANQVPYVGDVDGIASLYDLASDLEIISDSELKAYGWCYSINGVVPEGFVHQVYVTEPNSEVIWFYAYAHYKAGEWIAQCVKP